jgi:hypothetical protein
MNDKANLNFIIPHETSLVAHQIYNHNHIYLQIGDNLESILNQIDILLLDPSSQMNNEIVFRLALASAFQFAESLPDSSTSIATMKRMDWKYALFLPVNHPGISANTLCNFRQSLCSSSKALEELGKILEILGGIGLFKTAEIPCLDPKAMLSVICQTNRLFSVLEGIKSALGLVVSIAPEWVKDRVSPHWYQRYKTGPLVTPDLFQISDFQNYANRVGSDIFALLTALREFDAPDLVTHVEIRLLKQLFQEHYLQNGEAIQWRANGCANCLCNQQTVEGGHP